MKLFRLMACMLAVFLVFPLVGCKGAVSKVFSAFKKEVKEEIVEEGIKYAAGAAVGDNQGKSSSPSPSGKNSSKSNLGKTGGAAVVGGAAAVGGAVSSQFTGDSDLTLGKVSIGYSRDDVYSLMGKERKITDPGNTGNLRYQYPEMEVVITRGKVTGFVSNTAEVTTPRGIRQGDSLQKVLNAYGEPYAKSDFEGLTLYEYKMRSLDYNECLMRFAVKNGRVDYISARVLD